MARHSQGAQEKDGAAVLSVNPFRCKVWALHDRMDDYLTEESCGEEIESVKAHGQLVPALGRPLFNDPDHDIEIIYGARRLFIARNLGMPLVCQIRDMSDKDAAVAMDIENRHRKNTSPYERGMVYKRWLSAKVFASQEEIASALNVSASQVSRLLKLSLLPSVIFSAFESPLDVKEAWGLEFHKAWHTPNVRSLLAQRARTLAMHSPRPSAEDVYRYLLAPAAKGRPKLRHHDEVVLDDAGSPLFRIQRRRNSVSLVINLSKQSPQKVDAVRDEIAGILRHGTT